MQSEKRTDNGSFTETLSYLRAKLLCFYYISKPCYFCKLTSHSTDNCMIQSFTFIHKLHSGVLVQACGNILTRTVF